LISESITISLWGNTEENKRQKAIYIVRPPIFVVRPKLHCEFDHGFKILTHQCDKIVKTQALMVLHIVTIPFQTSLNDKAISDALTTKLFPRNSEQKAYFTLATPFAYWSVVPVVASVSIVIM
jgi:hypothetical protein